MKNNHRDKSNIAFLMRSIWTYNKKIVWIFALFTIFTAVQPFVGIFTPKLLLQEIIGAQRVYYLIAIIIIMTCVSVILDSGISKLKGLRLPELMRVRYKLVENIYDKILSMNYIYTEDTNVLNKLQLALKAVNSDSVGIEAIYLTLFNVVGNFLAIVGYSSIIITLHPLILFYMIVNVGILYAVTYMARKFAHEKEDELAEIYRKYSYIYNLVSDFLYGKDIRIFSLQNWLIERMKSSIVRNENINTNIYQKYYKVNVVDKVLLFFREGIVYFYMVHLVLQGNLDIANFIMYFTTISGFAALMQKLITDAAFIRGQNIYVKDYREFIDFIQKERSSKRKVPAPKEIEYSIEFENVSFKYPNSEKWILKNFNLKINKGSKIAIVGMNGAGKTTIIKLLTGLYTPQEGRILIDGIDIQCYESTSFSDLFSVVFQEIKPMAFSIADNIACCEHYNKETMDNAISRAGLKEKISSFPNGINSMLYKYFDPNGIELSLGEKQKLMLARALYKNAPLVILDEPTASLDPIAEYHVYRDMAQLTEEKTTMYISHRLSSTKFCDRIILLDNGNVIEDGTHGELMKLHKEYYRLFNMQAEYYRGGEKREEIC